MKGRARWSELNLQASQSFWYYWKKCPENPNVWLLGKFIIIVFPSDVCVLLTASVRTCVAITFIGHAKYVIATVCVPLQQHVNKSGLSSGCWVVYAFEGSFENDSSHRQHLSFSGCYMLMTKLKRARFYHPIREFWHIDKLEWNCLPKVCILELFSLSRQRTFSAFFGVAWFPVNNALLSFEKWLAENVISAVKFFFLNFKFKTCYQAACVQKNSKNRVCDEYRLLCEVLFEYSRVITTEPYQRAHAYVKIMWQKICCCLWSYNMKWSSLLVAL